MSLGAGLAAFLVTAALSGACWCHRPRTSECALGGGGPLVPDRAIEPSGRGDADLADDLRPACSNGDVRWLAAGAGRGRGCVFTAIGVVPTCRGNRVPGSCSISGKTCTTR